MKAKDKVMISMVIVNVLSNSLENIIFQPCIKANNMNFSYQQSVYRKILIIWAYICSKSFFAGLIFGGPYFQRGLFLEGILRFKMGWA